MKIRVQRTAMISLLALLALLTGCAASPIPQGSPVADAVRDEKPRSGGPRSATAAFFFERAHANTLSAGGKCVLLAEEGRCPLCGMAGEAR